jgi:hypothetical protein
MLPAPAAGAKRVPTSGMASAGGRSKRKATSPPSRRAVDAILSRREILVAELARLRAHGVCSSFVDNAQQLLTRWWSSASWSAREELLKNADWLVRMEHRRESGAPVTEGS